VGKWAARADAAAALSALASALVMKWAKRRSVMPGTATAKAASERDGV
jgi:hypothetical protein